MTQVAKKILVTCALPYANGSIHLGHMLEHIRADVWVRYQRMRGHEVNFICADDAHGTPIMLKAQQLGITPEQMIGEMSREHQTDFAGFNISYDNYHSTHSDENRELSELIYTRLKENGFIKNRTISQLYDPEKGMFLPDRFVKGTCPKCKSADQYGDNCEVCGATYSPTELIEPKSVVSGATPVMRDSEHFFFDLPSFSEMLQAWTRSGALQEQVANKMQEWFESGLQQWDISATRRILVSKSRTRRANISTSGWTRRLAIWAPSKICAISAVTRPVLMSTGKRLRRRAVSLYRQRHRLFPQPVLACHAGRQPLP